MKGRAISYSAEEMEWLEANRGMVISDYHAAFCARFARADASLVNLHALRKRKGWRTGRTGQFAPGQTPPNKGKAMPFNANSAATRFKPGSRSGRALERYKPIGTERMTKDGYLQRKMHDGLPMQSRWQLVQRVEWEAANGPIPDGYALKCLNGDKLDTAPSNWEPVPRGVLALLNEGRHRKRLAYDAAEPSLKPTVMLVAKLHHTALHARKRAAA